MSEDSQSPKAPNCQAHFTPSMMSTLTPGAKKFFKQPLPSFNPCHVSTERTLNFKMPEDWKKTQELPPRTAKEPSVQPMTTQEILESSTMVDMSSTLIKPSENVPRNIFDNSATQLFLFQRLTSASVTSSHPPL